jgi:hypothetical protein
MKYFAVAVYNENGQIEELCLEQTIEEAKEIANSILWGIKFVDDFPGAEVVKIEEVTFAATEEEEDYIEYMKERIAREAYQTGCRNAVITVVEEYVAEKE